MPSRRNTPPRTGLVLDERFEPRQRVVPLPGDVVEIFPRVRDRLRLEREQAFAPDAVAAHDARALEYAQMLCHRLPRQLGAVGQAGDRLRLAVAELGQHGEPRLVADGRQNPGTPLQPPPSPPAPSPPLRP